MPEIIYPSHFWSNIETWTSNYAPAVPSTGKNMAVTLFSKMPGFETNDLFFSASGVEYISGDPLSVPPQKLTDLLDSPFWTETKGLSNGTFFASGRYYVSPSAGDDRQIRLESGEFPDCSSGDDSYDFVAVGAAIWWMGTLAGQLNPLVALIRFDDELNIYKTSNGVDPPYYTENALFPQVLMGNRVAAYRNDNAAPSPSLGEFAITTPYVGWESPRETHVSMYPQRVNMVANPSFENGGTVNDVWGWRSNGTIAPTSLAVPASPGPDPRNLYLRAVSPSGSDPLVIESLPFPTAIAQDQWWSLEAAVASGGEGRVRIGLVSWESSAIFPSYQAGEWQTINVGAATSGDRSSFQTVRELISLPDRSYFAAFRLEYEGALCFLDNVLVDNNAAQLGYFDGDWYDGIDGDYSWYGGAAVSPKSYSLFYNDKANIKSLLFGYPEEVARPGTVSNLTAMTSAEMRTFNATFHPSAVHVMFDGDMTIREARDEYLSLNPAPAYAGVMQDGTIRGYLYDPLSQLTITHHHRGEAEKWVPEGAKVVPHYDDVYLFDSTSSQDSVYVLVEDFVVGTSVNYKTTVTKVQDG